MITWSIHVHVCNNTTIDYATIQFITQVLLKLTSRPSHREWLCNMRCIVSKKMVLLLDMTTCIGLFNTQVIQGKGKLYLAFVDFNKYLDTINRKYL